MTTPLDALNAEWNDQLVSTLPAIAVSTTFDFVSRLLAEARRLEQERDSLGIEAATLAGALTAAQQERDRLRDALLVANKWMGFAVTNRESGSRFSRDEQQVEQVLAATAPTETPR